MTYYFANAKWWFSSDGFHDSSAIQGNGKVLIAWLPAFLLVLACLCLGAMTAHPNNTMTH